MSKMLETKNKILALLKRRQMTISELSRELKLSTATVSQHMDELQRMGSIERVDNQHFKKLKYYRITEHTSETRQQVVSMSRYLAGVAVVIVVLAFMLAVYTPGLSKRSQNLPETTIAPNSSAVPATTSAASTPPPVAVQSLACPMIAYTLNGSITGHTGADLYNVSYNNGTIADYVIGAGSNATLNVTELVANVLNHNSSINYNRQHSMILFREGQGFNESHPGISMSITPATYNAVDNETLHATAILSANATANGTYWLYIDGPCGGGVRPVLITIGSKPYDGTVIMPSGTFI